MYHIVKDPVSKYSCILRYCDFEFQSMDFGGTVQPLTPLANSVCGFYFLLLVHCRLSHFRPHLLLGVLLNDQENDAVNVQGMLKRRRWKGLPMATALLFIPLAPWTCL